MTDVIADAAALSGNLTLGHDRPNRPKFDPSPEGLGMVMTPPRPVKRKVGSDRDPLPARPGRETRRAKRTMKAALYNEFGKPFGIERIDDPAPPRNGVVLRVAATGVCRSDWHGWMGHDADITLPNVPGHEMAGVVEAVGKDVRRWRPDDRVTVPFVCACGTCPECASGNQQVCDHQCQPGFTHRGSFAEYVALHHADSNLVGLPEDMDHTTAASLGCRFVTSFRAVVDQARLGPGEWIAVHGCGGVGLSAIMIAECIGANVVAVDISNEKLALAGELGAQSIVDASKTGDVPSAIRDLTSGGAHVSIDALGNTTTCFNSIACLRKRGRHVQVGLMLADDARPAIPMDRVVAHELEIYGSHGMQAHRYPAMMEMIRMGKLKPDRLVGRRIALEEAPDALMKMNTFEDTGVTVVTEF